MQWGAYNLRVRLEGIASRSDSAVLLEYGNTTVLATVVMAAQPKDQIEFIPLSVFYMEKAYAAHKIPGGYVKREGKNQDHEVLISRLIDRSIRPLIADGLQNEVQLIIQVLSYDPEVGTIVPSLIAASIAMQRSPVPFKGPIAACHVGLLNDEIVLNPTRDQLKNMDTDFIVAGNAQRLIMIEGAANELPLKTLDKMVKAAVAFYKPVIEMIKELPLKAKSLKKPLIVKAAQKLLKKQEALKNLFETQKRMDGRALHAIRPIKIESNVLPRVHSSCLFTRGDTQVLAVLTLGRADEKQSSDELSGFRTSNFLFHYNFLPFSVGEVDRMGPPSRREIGHGQIAYKALLPMLPDRFYTYRIVAEVLSSNGSSSMASVCAGSLSLMAAGIKTKRHVAGVALGLMKYKKQSAILVDITADEDHMGDMDLKICGTEKGINVLQMDVGMTEGLSLSTFSLAVKTGYQAVLEILETMNKTRRYPAKTLPEGVTKIDAAIVDKNKARQIFGKKGSDVAREIEKETETRIDTQDLNRILISADSFKNIFAAKKRVYQALGEFDKETVYDATVMCVEDSKFKVQVKDVYQGPLVFESKLKKVKKGAHLKVVFVKFDHHGDPEFQLVTV